jgi:rhodanese-related sulfurtransferase
MLATHFAPTPFEAWMKAHPSAPGTILAGLCLVLLVFVAWPRLRSWRRGKGRPVLDPVQVDELLLGPGALVVDLRPLEAFRSGHIRGSLHVPFPEVGARFTRPDPQARRAMVLVDETDALAHQAFGLLQERGFDWLYVMQGGMKAWRRANRPLVK